MLIVSKPDTHLSNYYLLLILCIIRCNKCGGLLRPHVVWFGEALDTKVLQKTDEVLEKCDLCLLVSGTAKINKKLQCLK